MLQPARPAAVVAAQAALIISILCPWPLKPLQQQVPISSLLLSHLRLTATHTPQVTLLVRKVHPSTGLQTALQQLELQRSVKHMQDLPSSAVKPMYIYVLFEQTGVPQDQSALSYRYRGKLPGQSSCQLACWNLSVMISGLILTCSSSDIRHGCMMTPPHSECFHHTCRIVCGCR